MESNSLGILEISDFNSSLVLNKEIYPLLKQNTAIIIMAPSFKNVYIITNENLCQKSTMMEHNSNSLQRLDQYNLPPLPQASRLVAATDNNDLRLACATTAFYWVK
jgi:hypothetical protein